MRTFNLGQDLPRAMEHGRHVIQGFSEVMYSRVLDRLAEAHLPPGVLTPFLRAYCRVYDVDVAEVPSPLQDYRSFREFFVRPVRAGMRHVDNAPARLTSPVDARILASGLFDGQTPVTMRIKGRIYTLEDLLGTREAQGPIESGGFVLFYLAPGGYHRFHSPVAGSLTGVAYLPGTRRPVNRIGRRLFPDVYVTNRRVVVRIRAAGEPGLDVLLVLIGAMGVGRIVMEIGGRPMIGDGDLEWRARPDPPVTVGRGDEIGHFDLGSSAVLVWSGAGKSTILAPDGPVKMGAPVVTLGTRREDA